MAMHYLYLHIAGNVATTYGLIEYVANQIIYFPL